MSDDTKLKRSARLISRPILAGALAMTVLPAVHAEAAPTLFLKITDIKGESMDDKHRGEIEVSSFSAGFASSSTQNGTVRLGKPACGPVTINKNLDSASGPLVNALMKGAVLPEAVVEITTTVDGKGSVPYYRVTMKNVTVSSLSQSGDGDARPTEELELLPLSVQMEYRMQDEKGTLTPFSSVTVDCKK